MADVAFLFDLNGLLRDTEERGGARPVEVEALLDAGERLGRLVVRRAYGDWADPRFRSLRFELLDHGVELVSGAGRGRDSTTRLVVDAMEALAIHRHITHFVLASGDPELVYLVQKLREHGKHVALVAPRGVIHGALRAVADGTLPYHESTAQDREYREGMADDRYPPPVRDGKPVPMGPHRRIRLHGTAIPLFTADVRKSVIDGLYDVFRSSDGVDVRAATSEVAGRSDGSYDQYAVERIQQTLYYAKAFVLRGGMHDAILAPEISGADDLHRRYDRHLAALIGKEYPILDSEGIAEILAEDPKQANYIKELLEEAPKEPGRI
jgi:hypothetical protein